MAFDPRTGMVVADQAQEQPGYAIQLASAQGPTYQPPSPFPVEPGGEPWQPPESAPANSWLEQRIGESQLIEYLAAVTCFTVDGGGKMFELLFGKQLQGPCSVGFLSVLIEHKEGERSTICLSAGASELAIRQHVQQQDDTATDDEIQEAADLRCILDIARVLEGCRNIVDIAPATRERLSAAGFSLADFGKSVLQVAQVAAPIALPAAAAVVPGGGLLLAASQQIPGSPTYDAQAHQQQVQLAAQQQAQAQMAAKAQQQAAQQQILAQQQALFQQQQAALAAAQQAAAMKIAAQPVMRGATNPVSAQAPTDTPQMSSAGYAGASRLQHVVDAIGQAIEMSADALRSQSTSGGTLYDQWHAWYLTASLPASEPDASAFVKRLLLSWNGLGLHQVVPDAQTQQILDGSA